jgi:hypothetical protein
MPHGHAFRAADAGRRRPVVDPLVPPSTPPSHCPSGQNRSMSIAFRPLCPSLMSRTRLTSRSDERSGVHRSCSEGVPGWPTTVCTFWMGLSASSISASSSSPTTRWRPGRPPSGAARWRWSCGVDRGWSGAGIGHRPVKRLIAFRRIRVSRRIAESASARRGENRRPAAIEREHSELARLRGHRRRRPVPRPSATE